MFKSLKDIDCYDAHKMPEEEFVAGLINTIRESFPSMAIDFDAAFRQSNPWRISTLE
jgi:hypothetical protein